MNQNIDLTTKAQFSNGEDFRNESSGLSKWGNTSISPALLIGRGSRHLGRDGPPGRARSPGSNLRQEPHPVPLLQFNKTITNNHLIQTKIHSFFNFFIMKKQILFLVFLVLAVVANVNKSFGQGCAGAPLTPAPGVEYPYGVTVSGVTTNATYLWYVTEGTNLLTGAHTAANAGFFTVSTGTGLSTYDAVTGGTKDIKLTWLPAAIGKTFYLVEKTTADGVSNGVVCTVENLKVYEIKPINTFLLAVVGSDLSGDPAKSETCVANVFSAAVSGSDVTYTYGQNTLYYKITASGILGSWKPSISLPALGGQGQNYESAHWTSDGGTNWKSFGLTTGDIDGGSFASTDNATVTDATAGTPIIVKVVINNANFETLANQSIVMGVDGFLPTGYDTISDIVGGTGTTACDQAAVFAKTGTSTITARPTIAPTVPTTVPFMP